MNGFVVLHTLPSFSSRFKHRFSVYSFRGRLMLWFSGLALLILLALGMYLGRLAMEQMAVARGEVVRMTASTAADLLGSNLRERAHEIELLSRAPHFVRGDLSHPDVLVSLQQRRNLRQEYAWLGVVDVDGKIIQAADGLLQGLSVAQRPWFGKAKQRPYMGDVHDAAMLSKLLSRPPSAEPLRVIDFAAPIRNAQGALVGVVGAHGHWLWVTNTVKSVVERLGPDSGMELLIVDNDGRILYPQALAGPTSLPRAIPTNTRYSVLTWEDGHEYVASSAAVTSGLNTDPLGWRIVARQPLERWVAPIQAMRMRIWLVGVMAAALFALVALRLASSVSRPIEQLAAAAQHIERHEGQPYFPQSPLREVAQLSLSMQSMTATLLSREKELQRLNHTLEDQVAQRTVALTIANQELERLSTQDGLTGVANRRRFDERLAECMAVGQRTGRAFALLMLDIDHFKSVNDTHGHAAGDRVLQQFAQLIQAQTRGTDFVARYGGEEFAVLLPQTQSHAEAAKVAEKIRKAVAQASFADVGHVTVSIGHGLWSDPSMSAAALLMRVDQALYVAKANGRNRVVAATPDEAGDATP